MLIPAMVDVAARNADWQAFVMSALVTGLIGLLLSVAVGGSLSEGLNMRQTFVLTTLSWMTLPAFGALPFLWLGIGYADAVFEAALPPELGGTGGTEADFVDAMGGEGSELSGAILH